MNDDIDPVCAIEHGIAMSAESILAKLSSLDGVAGTSKPASFRQLMVFEAVGRLGNLTRGARECGLSQPAATQALSALQANIGFALMKGKVRSIGLTERGEEFHKRLGPILQQAMITLQQLGIAAPAKFLWGMSPLRLRHLEALHEFGSLEKAALGLGLSRRSLLRAVGEIEALAGSRLTGFGIDSVSHNGTGTVLAQQLGLMAGEIARHIQHIGQQADQDNRTIVIGAAPDPGTASLTALIKAQLAACPELCIEVIEDRQSNLLKRLATGEIDLLVGHILEADRSDVSWTLLATSSFRIVARQGHPLAALRRVPVRELAEQVWAFGAQGSQRRAASEILFAGHQLPSCALVTSAAPLIAQVLTDSDLVAMMTDRELLLRQDSLSTIDHDAPNIIVRLGWACRTGWIITPRHQQFIDGLQTCFAAQSRSG